MEGWCAAATTVRKAHQRRSALWLNLNESYDFANAPVIQVLQEAKEQGLCRFLGITCDDHAEETAYLLRNLSVDLCLVARNYHLLTRRARRREDAGFLEGEML